MPSKEALDLLDALQEDSSIASTINWDKLGQDEPDLNIGKIRLDLGIADVAGTPVEQAPSVGADFLRSIATPEPVQEGIVDIVGAAQPVTTAVGIRDKPLFDPTAPPEEPKDVQSVVRNAFREVGAIVDVDAQIDDLRRAIEFVEGTDPFTKQGRAKYKKVAIPKLGEIARGMTDAIQDWNRVLTFAKAGLPVALIKKTFGKDPNLVPEHVKESLQNIGQNPLAGPLSLAMIAGVGRGAGKLPAKVRALKPKVGLLAERQIKPVAPIETKGVKIEVPFEPALEKLTGAVDPTDVSIQNITQALREAKPARKAQEILFSKERKIRLARLRKIQKTTAGEAGFFAEKGQLKGELPKVEFESIRGKVSQADIDNIFNKVKDAGVLTEFEKITAREGLSKMLTEAGGRVPTRGELKLLDQVFPLEFMETLLAKRSLGVKTLDAVMQAANIPRSIMSSFDLSFGGRQGAFAAPKFRRAFWDSWKKQFKIFGSEKAYQASREALIADKDFIFAKESGLSFTEVGKTLTQREERFQSQWAEKIPIIGKGVKASGRAYTAFANKYRLDIFKQLVGDAEIQGFRPRDNRFLTRKIADFANNATGRGSLGSFENAAVALNAVFFSPRLNIARLKLLNPIHYINQPKFLRKQMLSTALRAAGTATTILTAAKLGGLDVTANPLSADFGKIKIGDTRLDMLAGFGQIIRGGAQIAAGQYISTTTGKKVKLGEGFRAPTRMDILIRQIESKESPIASFATGLLRGRGFAGEEFSVPKEIADRFTPMVISDVIDLAKDDPKLIPLAIPALFGVGLQTYSGRRSTGRR